jgi:signal transduction histidine kinase
MSKRKAYLNRLNEIFKNSEEVQPEPLDDKYYASSTEDEALFKAIEDELTIPPPDPLDDDGHFEYDIPIDEIQTSEQIGKIGWEDYLDGIERSERIGFTYNQDQILPFGFPYHADEDIDGNTENINKDDDNKNGRIIESSLQLGDMNLGKLILEGKDSESWSLSESDVVANVARQISQHIENIRLIEQAEQYREEAEQALRRLTREGWKDYIKPTSEGVMGYTYDLNQVVTLDQDTDNIDIEDDITQEITIRDETIGTLSIADVDENAKELVDTVTNRLSQHIESLRLLDETEKSRQQLDIHAAQLETVAKVSTAATTLLDPQSLMQSVVDLTKYSFNLYHSHIFLLNLENNTLTASAGSGKVGQEMQSEGFFIPLNHEHSIVATVARNQTGMIVNDVNSVPNFLPHPLLPGTKSELAVPLNVGDDIVGVLDVQSDVIDRFTEDDMAIFATLASQIAVALRNAELYEEQIQTVTRLRELDHLKSAFLANMSHELRTPLNAILGFTQVIIEGIDGPLTENMEDDLQLIEKNGQHLLKLINDVLDMAKIEAGRMSLSLEPFDIQELIVDVLETTRPLADEKELTLDLEIDPDIDLSIIADRFRLRQILLNLIGNSIKFTEEGGTTTSIEKITDKIYVKIKDTGIGIPPDKLESIFEAFSQVDASTTRKAGGTGLGLPISRRLVEMHGGWLWAESSGISGEGSVLNLELPIVAVETPMKEY